jgi:DNA polymerase-3 subunit epsilon
MTPSKDRTVPFLRRIRVRLIISLVLISVIPFLIISAAILSSLPEGTAPDVMTPIYVMGVFLGLFCAFVAWQLAEKFTEPIDEIRHGAEIIARINLSHRISVKTGDELESLARDFNDMAQALEGAYSELEDRVRQVTLNLQEEKSRLATVLRTMVEGVVAVNEVGEIILMNPRARSVLAGAPEFGVGSPLNRLLPKGRVDYHMRRLRAAWEEGRDIVEQVIFPLPGGKLLKGVMAAMPGPSGERAGFLLAFRDVTDEAEREKQIETALRTLPTRLKSPMTSVQSIAQILETHKNLSEEKQQAFVCALRSEVESCLVQLQEGEKAEARMPSSHWQGQPTDAKGLVEEALAAIPGVYAHFQPPEGPLPPVAVEPYGCILAMSSVLRWLAANSTGWNPVEATLEAEGDMVVATFRLAGSQGPNPEGLESMLVEQQGEEPITIAEAVKRNRGEIWTRVSEGSFEVRFGMVRASRMEQSEGGVRIFDDQPDFYDFDLFLARSGAEVRETLDRDLKDLEIVVFDTETTGLRPLKGDRVVSLSAVRIRKGRIVQAGDFHTLVNPHIPIPKESTVFHGLTDATVKDAPSIPEVYKSFTQYIGGAVLVAHNAAFDMKFLEIAARENGLPQIDNPVLDTLFLSYGVHGDLPGHNLDTIAERLGVTIEGRHTSDGDARATAEIFVRLLPLLEARGVRTLGQAKAFCDRNLILRWQASRF